MEINARGDALYSLGIAPILMGLGHLPPAIGAIHVATESYQYPVALLVIIVTTTTLVDSHDTYKDLSHRNRPRKWIWRLWTSSLWGSIFICTFCIGYQAAIKIYRFSLVGLLWGTPCIPLFSPFSGFRLLKPKSIFREAKSLVVAVCMGYITADTSMFHLCHEDAKCSPDSIRVRALYLAVLYQFFRETACDIRDIPEDSRNGMKTLPVRLGRNKTLLMMAVLGVVLENSITGSTLITMPGIQINMVLVVESGFRVGVLVGFYATILQYPRRSKFVWGVAYLLGLMPVMWAQYSLVSVFQ